MHPLQEEVAQRLVDATPSRKDYRAMSVFTHFYSQPLYRFRIPKEKYFPVPGVDGALVTFRLRPPGQRLPVPDERGFIQMVGCWKSVCWAAGRHVYSTRAQTH